MERGRRWWSVTSLVLVMSIAVACSPPDDAVPGQPTGSATAAPASGPPAVDSFTAPEVFQCMPQYADQAQVQAGWSAPDATDLTWTLDGDELPKGIQDSVPFQVPARDATGVGVTIVFACSDGDTHTIEGTWTANGSPPTVKSFTVTKEAGA